MAPGEISLYVCEVFFFFRTPGVGALCSHAHIRVYVSVNDPVK